MRIHLQNVKLYDGTLKKPRVTDVLIEGDRMTAVQGRG